MDYPATHPVILSYNKLPCINHFQPPSRPSCQWKPNFKQRFHQIHSVHIVLQLARHDLITGTSTLRPKLWNPVSSENAWVLENWPRFRGCPSNPPPLHEFAQFLGCEPPAPHTHTHPAKTCLSAWIFPGMRHVMHFLTTPTLLTNLQTFYAFFIRTQF